MASKKSNVRQRGQAAQRAITRGKIRKLQKAGILSGKIDADKPPSQFVKSQFYKYRSVISDKQAAVKLSSAKKAAELRNKIGEGGRGKIVIVPREPGEKFTVTKDDTIKSRRTQYGQRIEKTIGDKFSPPRAGEKVYYTIPRRKRGTGSLKRRTFASFDEMLFYLTKYEIEFEDIEDYIEVERVHDGSRKQKQVAKEYNAARAKLLRKRKRKSRKPRGGLNSRK